MLTAARLVPWQNGLRLARTRTRQLGSSSELKHTGAVLSIIDRNDDGLWIRNLKNNCVAPIGKNWSTQDLQASLEQDLGISNVTVLGVEKETKVGVALAQPGGITVKTDDNLAPSILALAGATQQTESRIGEIELLRARQRLLRALESHQSIAVTRNEFDTSFSEKVETVATLSKMDSAAVLETLEAAGAVAISDDRIIIQPRAYLHLADRFDGDPPLRALQQQECTKINEQQHHQGGPLAASLRWTIAASVTALYSYLFYLTYIYLSWDIVEPITFFVASGVSLAGYFWCLLTRSELSYSSVMRILLSRK